MTSTKALISAAVVLLCASSGAMAEDPPGPTTLPPFKQLDADQNGGITTAEAAQLPALAEQFADVDSNADGWISVDEYAVAGGDTSTRNPL
ncbi:MAG: hypothetical protein ACREV3_13530 [Gammaproteobacteria bacterium]